MVKFPAIQGVIRRRFLLNFRIDPEVLQKLLPPVFEPKLQGDYAIGGICLIRLEGIKPKAVPLDPGITSENAAHRFAVKWQGGEGVYIPRRDTDSILNHVAGGRVFPGVHHLARFGIEEHEDSETFEFWMKSIDDEAEISFSGSKARALPETSCFEDLATASKFFELGRLGYSESGHHGRLEGLLLHTRSWRVQPFEVHDIFTSYFARHDLFPPGSVTFDHALIMEDIEHEWHAVGELLFNNAPQPAR